MAIVDAYRRDKGRAQRWLFCKQRSHESTYVECKSQPARHTRGFMLDYMSGHFKPWRRPGRVRFPYLAKYAAARCTNRETAASSCGSFQNVWVRGRNDGNDDNPDRVPGNVCGEVGNPGCQSSLPTQIYAADRCVSWRLPFRALAKYVGCAGLRGLAVPRLPRIRLRAEA